MIEDKKEPVVLNINPIFEPLFYDSLEENQPRYYIVYGGRGSGKSHAGSTAAVNLTYSPYNHKIIYLRQTMTSSNDSTISDVRSSIIARRAQNNFTETRNLITNNITGSAITFLGIRASSGEQTAKLKGLSSFTTVIIEEAEEIQSFEEFSKIDESIRIKNKPLKIILIFNPGAVAGSWIHKEFFENGQPKIRKDTIYMHSTYLDNIHNLNESVIRRYEDLKVSNPLYYRNIILAEWTQDDQLQIYGGWQLYPKMEERGTDVVYGMDFSYFGKDKTSVVRVTFLEGVYYCQLMFSVAKLTIGATLIKMRREGVSVTARIYCDASNPLLREEIRIGGFHNIRSATRGNVEAEIKKIQDKKIVIIGEEENALWFSYQTFRRNKNGKLPHEPDELASLRYAINSHRFMKEYQKPVTRRAMRRGDFL